MHACGMPATPRAGSALVDCRVRIVLLAKHICRRHTATLRRPIRHSLNNQFLSPILEPGEGAAHVHTSFACVCVYVCMHVCMCVSFKWPMLRPMPRCLLSELCS